MNAIKRIFTTIVVAALILSVVWLGVQPLSQVYLLDKLNVPAPIISYKAFQIFAFGYLAAVILGAFFAASKITKRVFEKNYKSALKLYVFFVVVFIFLMYLYAEVGTWLMFPLKTGLSNA